MNRDYHELINWAAILMELQVSPWNDEKAFEVSLQDAGLLWWVQVLFAVLTQVRSVMCLNFYCTWVLFSEVTSGVNFVAIYLYGKTSQLPHQASYTFVALMWSQGILFSPFSWEPVIQLFYFVFGWVVYIEILQSTFMSAMVVPFFMDFLDEQYGCICNQLMAQH